LTSKIIKGENAASRAIRSGLTLFAALILILLNFLCYQQTLGGYFLADDYVHVAYLSDVFNGHLLKLLENFTGNWMHAWGTQFYRPFISLTLAFDYWLGGGSPLAFHISNTLFHCASSIFLFLATRRLLVQFEGKQRFFCAFVAAALFSVCPLHTEVVSWIIGRVDGVCLAFFLGAYYFYLRHRQEKNALALPLSMGFFVISLLSKEMSVTLPPLLVMTNFLLSNEKNLWRRFLLSLKETFFYWLLLGLYFVVRTLALGTVSGGYGGSLGAGLSGSLGERLKTAIKIVYPFNSEVISTFDRVRKQVTTLYIVTAILFGVRILLFRGASKQLKLLLFCALWFVLTLIPAYQVFNITDSLMCSRFAYFASVPVCLFLAILITPCWECPADRFVGLARWWARISLVLICCFLAIFANVTIRNNSSWAHAGKQVREFRLALASECASLPGSASVPLVSTSATQIRNASLPSLNKLVLLNLPQRFEGAHIIYNAAMLHVLLSEPLSKPAIADRVISFEPPTYGEAEFINASRLRKIVAEHPQYIYCFWDMKSMRLLKLSLSSSPCDLKFALQFPLNDTTSRHDAKNAASSESVSVISPPLDLPPLAADFVVCSFSLPALSASNNHTPGGSNSRTGVLTLSWSSKQFSEFSQTRSIPLAVKYDGQKHEYYFPVSERKSWIAGETINRLRLQLLSPAKMPESELNKSVSMEVRVLSGQNLIPILQPAPEQLAEGIDGIDRMVEKHFDIDCDSRKIPGVASIALELSKPNSWFEHYAGTFRDRKFSDECLKRYTATSNVARFHFERSDFPQPAFYELRAFALDKDGNVIGYCSDPINLQID